MEGHLETASSGEIPAGTGALSAEVFFGGGRTPEHPTPQQEGSMLVADVILGFWVFDFKRLVTVT